MMGLALWSLPGTAGAAPYQAPQSPGEARGEPGDPPSQGGPAAKSVWYRFTPATDVVLRADTLGSDFDTVLAVWTGSDLASLSPVACNDDVFSAQSIAVFAAEAGVTFAFQVGGYEGAA